MPRFVEQAIRRTPLERLCRRLLRWVGYDVVRHPITDIALLENYGITVVLDVGANVGQYGHRKRSLGYTGRLVSFEPLEREFAALEVACRKDGNWQCQNVALGNEDGETTINVARWSTYSSILTTTGGAPGGKSVSSPVGTQTITIKRLDALFDTICEPADRVYLKADTQGYEKNVIDGAGEALTRISVIELELSFKRQYEGELLAYDMIDYLRDRGFTLVALQPLTHCLRSGHLVQADGFFVRELAPNTCVHSPLRQSRDR